MKKTLHLMVLAAILIILFTGSGAYSLSHTTPVSAAPHPLQTSCGQVSARLLNTPPFSPNADVIENCFWQAYHPCLNSSLSYTLMGIDTGATRQFWLTKQGLHCQIHEALRYYMFPRRVPPIIHYYTCIGMRHTRAGLYILGCGNDGNILIPA